MKWNVLTDDPKSYPQQPPVRIDELGRRWSTASDNFIVTDTKGKVYMAFYNYGCLRHGKGEFYWRNTDHPVDVIAWMPMPEPYREGRTEVE